MHDKSNPAVIRVDEGEHAQGILPDVAPVRAGAGDEDAKSITNGRRRFLKQVVTITAMGVAFPVLPEELPHARAASPALGQPVEEQQPMNANNGDEVLRRHPASATLQRLFAGGAAPHPASGSGFRLTGLTRADYLPLLAGNVSFFRQHQNAAGVIIDPLEKKERQYATPAFAHAAATLVAAGQTELLDAATRAFTFSLEALAKKTTADNHADFYIPMLIHAYRKLRAHVSRDVADHWRQLFFSLVPEKTYRDTGGRGNWNLVHVAGEWMRRKDGLVAPEQEAAQAAYLERSLTRQKETGAYTPMGMYHDMNAPLAYDAFPRLWLEDMLADGAYTGPHHAHLREFLTTGGLSTLLLLSPSGEWASGGRSAHHQWNEAQVAVICEINARRWKEWGRPDVAGAFKRAARLALASVRRWQRPSGELWIVKNRAEPKQRHGFEGYSFHSQYNLLAMAMLAIAYERADETIEERLTPSEAGGYVFDVRDTFHKVCASAGGTYILIDTGADTHYDSTGLLRIHKAGVAFSPYSGNSAGHRWYGPGTDPVKVGMSPGIQWKDGATGAWRSLADFQNAKFAGKDNNAAIVTQADLSVLLERPERAVFTVRYGLKGEGARPVEEEYTVNASGVEVVTRLAGESAPAAATRVLFPALVSDGASDTRIIISGSRATIHHSGAALTWEVVSPEGARLALEGSRVPTHNGYAQALVADLPGAPREVRWRLHLANSGPVR